MKTLILVESTHHGNTKKLAVAVAKTAQAEIIDVTGEEYPDIDFAPYDLIGIASGIKGGHYYQKISEIADTIPKGKKVFFLYTSANNSKDYSIHIRRRLEKHGCNSLGTYSCKGFSTYGPLKLIGGINKTHPNEKDLLAAEKFYTRVRMKYSKN